MNHGMQEVDLVNEAGIVVGTKKRREIHKQVDLYHTVFTLVITPKEEVLLSRIPERRDLPNIYSGLLGATVATMRRHDETANEASIRSVKNELQLENIAAVKIDEGYQQLPNSVRKYMSVYCAVHPKPDSFSRQDIEALYPLTYDELAQELEIHPELFAPTFVAIWEKCGVRIRSDMI